LDFTKVLLQVSKVGVKMQTSLTTQGEVGMESSNKPFIDAIYVSWRALDTKDARIAELEEELEKTQSSLPYISEALNSTIAELGKAEEEVQELSDILEAYDMYSIELEKANADLEDKVKYLNSWIARKDKALAEAEEENRQLTKELTKAYDELIMLRSILKDHGIQYLLVNKE
jgi:chromosome segregation ATPase